MMANEKKTCPSCRGSRRGPKDLRFDEDRGQWLVYRGGWYPCEKCGGTGEVKTDVTRTRGGY